MTADPWDMLDAELADTLEAARGNRWVPPGRRPPEKPPEDVVRRAPPGSVDCPDCGAACVIQTGGFCPECGLTWDDLMAAADMYARLVREAQEDAALPSPRNKSIPRKRPRRRKKK